MQPTVRDSSLDTLLEAYRRAATTSREGGNGRKAGRFAAATASAFAMAGGAEAAVIYSGTQNLVLEPYRFNASTLATLRVDIDGADGDDVKFRVLIGSSFSAGYGGYSRYLRIFANAGVDQRTFFSLPNAGLILGDSGGGARRLSSGATISAGAGPFVGDRPQFNDDYYLRSTSGSVMNTTRRGGGAWAGSTTGLLGIALQRSGNTHYGWIRLQLEDRGGAVAPGFAPDGASDRITVVDWAWDDVPGQGIAAGATVPEPSTLQLLAAGALGIHAFRKRRREREETGD